MTIQFKTENEQTTARYLHTKKEEPTSTAILPLVGQANALIHLFKSQDVTDQTSDRRTQKAREIYRKACDHNDKSVNFWLKRSPKTDELMARLYVEGESGVHHTTISETWAGCTCPDAKKPENTCKHLRALSGLVLKPPTQPETPTFPKIADLPSIPPSTPSKKDPLEF